MIINSPTELVFRDLFYRLNGFANGHDVFLKLEGLHITGSIKFKTAMGLIEDIERRGAKPGETTVIESSSGNLGMALSLVCASKGFRFICVTDPKANTSNIKGMQLYGAEVIVIDKLHPETGYLGTRLETIQKLLKSEPNAVWLNQYANTAAKDVHAEQTGEEIAQEFDNVDWIFVGAGTMGTITGVAERLREKFPGIKVVAVEPEGSVTFGGKSEKRSIPGIGTSVRPPLADYIVPDYIVTISEVDTVESCRQFVRDHNLLVGGSTGAVLAAVKEKQSEFAPGDTIVAISPDLGEKYLDTVYEPSWVAANIDHILPNLDDADISWMATTAGQKLISKGDVLVSAGEPVEALYILLEGELSVVHGDVDGGKIVAMLAPGDIVGEMSLIEKRLPTVSVVAAADARVLVIPQSDIYSRIQSDNEFAARFYKAFAVFLSHRLRTTTTQFGSGGVGYDEWAARIERPTELDDDSTAPLHVVGDRMQRLLARLDDPNIE